MSPPPMGYCAADRAPQGRTNPRQRAARALAGGALLALTAAAARAPSPLNAAMAGAAGWLGVSHLVAAATGYNGCPELGAIRPSCAANRYTPAAGRGRRSTVASGLSKPRRSQPVVEQITYPKLSELLHDPATQLVDVLPEEEYRTEASARRDQHPPQAARRQHHDQPRPQPAGSRVLLGQPLRHEPTSRVPARNARLRARLRLHDRQSRLARQGTTHRRRPKARTSRQRHRPRRCRASQPQRARRSRTRPGRAVSVPVRARRRRRRDAPRPTAQARPRRRPNATSEQAMEPGPSTVRLDTVASELAQRLRQHNLKTATATDPEGRLAGVVRLADLDA